MGPGDHGQGEIIFQLGSQIRLLDLATKQASSVPISIPGDRPTIRPHAIDAAAHMTGSSLSPTGKRVAVEARGDIWTLPAKEGAPRNLTRTDGYAERDPSWSPDGKWIAYFSDNSGEYELYLLGVDGKADARQITHAGAGYRYNPNWSPDSKHLTFTDKAGAMILVSLGEADAAEVKQIDVDPWDEQMGNSWSGDSNWIAYARNDDGESNKCIWFYNVKSGEKTRVTDPMFESDAPVFDRKGDYLYFRTTRHFQSPIYGETDSSFVYAGARGRAAAGGRKVPVGAQERRRGNRQGEEGSREEGRGRQGQERRQAEGWRQAQGRRQAARAEGRGQEGRRQEGRRQEGTREEGRQEEG
jgi:tricorn protease